MIGTTRTKTPPPSGPELWHLDPDHDRYAVAVGGRITYAGSKEECERRLEILTRKDDRMAQDYALRRLFR